MNPLGGDIDAWQNLGTYILTGFLDIWDLDLRWRWLIHPLRPNYGDHRHFEPSGNVGTAECDIDPISQKGALLAATFVHVPE